MNVFVTVGVQMSFDRLIMVVDGWVASHTGMHIYAQIGETSYRPVHIEYVSVRCATDITRQSL